MKSIHVLFALLLFGQILFAAEQFVVSDVQIQGLKRTHSWIILRELEFSIGDTVSQNELILAEKRLQNLTFLNSVSLHADSGGTVIVDVREAWPILPLLTINLTEGTVTDILKSPHSFFKKATIFAGVGHLNFRGSGSMALAYAQLGAAQGLSFEYHTRCLSPHIPLAVDAGISNLRALDREWSVRDSTAYLRSANYFLSVATRAGAPNRLGLRLQYLGIEKETPLPHQPRRTRTFWLSPFVIMDRRDLEWYPSRGVFARVGADFTGGDKQFVRSQYDLRGYFPFSKRSRSPLLALRFYGATSTSSTSGWAEYFWGFSSALRGYTGIQSQSAGYLVGDVEFRFPITREKTYNAPFIGSYGERWPFGIYGLVFAQRAELQRDGRRDERGAIGGGLHVRLPYVQILEIAIAINRDGDTEYEINTGVSF